MTEARSSELLVIAARRSWSCADCSTGFEPGEFLTMDDAGPLCLHCADLGHLAFLPRGDTALTRRARTASRLSAVVVRWSRARKRYERQGILAEPDAIAQAEQECLADSEARERHGERDAQRRAVEDEKFVAGLAAAVLAQFPGCPAERALRIARHAGARSSGRIGRTGAGRALDPEAAGSRRRGPARGHELCGPADERRATCGQVRRSPATVNGWVLVAKSALTTR